MSEKDLCAFSVQEFCNYIWNIFTNETFAKYCIIHSLIEPAMAVITIHAEEIKTVTLFKGDNDVVNYPIAYAEVKV